MAILKNVLLLRRVGDDCDLTNCLRQLGVRRQCSQFALCKDIGLRQQAIAITSVVAAVGVELPTFQSVLVGSGEKREKSILHPVKSTDVTTSDREQESTPTQNTRRRVAQPQQRTNAHPGHDPALSLRAALVYQGSNHKSTWPPIAIDSAHGVTEKGTVRGRALGFERARESARRRDER